MFLLVSVADFREESVLSGQSDVTVQILQRAIYIYLMKDNSL